MNQVGKERDYFFEESKEDLLLSYFPGNDDSPRMCHLKALICIENGFFISPEVKEAILLLSVRYRENVEDEIDAWNKTVTIKNKINLDFLRQMVGESLMRTFSLSYGKEKDNFSLRGFLIQRALILANKVSENKLMIQ